jgi:hypothetical protein
MVNVRVGLTIVAALSAAALAACGGSQFALTVDGGADSGDAGSGGDTGASNDAGSGGDGSPIDAGHDASTGTDAGGVDGGGADGGQACPDNVPAAGSPCPSSGLACEYGTSANVGCDTVVRCTASGWSMPDVSQCAMGQCPASYDAVPMGQLCSPQGLDCSYPKGTCTCSASPGPVLIVDGSILVDWHCFPAVAGCPSPRPRIGAPCSQEGTSCDYGACTGGVELSCTGRTWQEQGVACPG